MTAWSLRRRLAGWLILALVLIGALALVDTRAEAIRTATGVSDRILAGSAMAIADGVTISADGGLDILIPFSAFEMLSSTAQDRVFYRVDGPTGFLTGYPDLPRVPALGVAPAFSDLTYRDTPLRAATLQRVLSSDQGAVPVTVTVAESTLARDALSRAILARSALRLAALILSAAAVVWIVTTLALRPLGRIGQAIALRRPDDLSPITADMPQEIGGLVGSVNGFMARLDAAISALRGFAAHANHQIRTPLATARTEIALARREGPAPPALDRADAALIRAERVLAQLLLLSRVQAAGQKPPAEPVDLARMAQEIAADLIPLAAARGQDLGYDGPAELSVTAEPVLLGEAIRNLADNAIRHSGTGSSITLRVRGGTGGARLTVEDTGPGLPAAPAAPADAGHGLGLLIVRQIALALGADLTLAPGPGGRGLAATLTWPAPEG